MKELANLVILCCIAYLLGNLNHRIIDLDARVIHLEKK